MKLKDYQGDVKIINSPKIKKWYDWKALMNTNPTASIVGAFSTVKGYGKTYGAINHIIVPRLNKGHLGVWMFWTEQEKDALILDLKNHPQDFMDKLDFEEVEFEKSKLFTILKSKGHTIMYFITASQIGILKLIADKSDQEKREVILFWDECIKAKNIYVKPKETIHALFQALGSIARKSHYLLLLTANDITPNNPWRNFLFKNIGWPLKGQTVLGIDTRCIIDNPLINEWQQREYEETDFYANSKLIPELHEQLFLNSNSFGNPFVNEDLIIPICEHDLEHEFSIRYDVTDLHIFQHSPKCSIDACRAKEALNCEYYYGFFFRGVYSLYGHFRNPYYSTVGYSCQDPNM